MPDSGSDGLVVVYFIGTIGMILLAAGIFFFFITYQKRLLRKQLELNKVKSEQQDKILRNTISAQEKERKRIARDLHDDVGAMLSVVKLNIGRIEKKSEELLAKELVVETKSHLDEVITRVRQISRSLLPPSLGKLGLYFALEELCSWINKSDQVFIDCFKIGEQFRFDNKMELAVFRIVQELLNNSIKHSGAERIKLITRFSNNRLNVLFTDNGKGFNLEEKLNSGLGLRNLESRSQILGAKYKLKSVPGKGTTAIISLKTE